MLYFFDTEFIDCTPAIYFISIGIVSEDNRTYYAVCNEFPEDRLDDWLKRHVVPHLPDRSLWKSRETIKQELIEFLGDKPKFWVYNGAFDWVVFCQIFGTIRDLPKHYPWFACDIKQWWYDLKNPKLPEQPRQTRHHALEDAKWTKQLWEFLQEHEKNHCKST